MQTRKRLWTIGCIVCFADGLHLPESFLVMTALPTDAIRSCIAFASSHLMGCSQLGTVELQALLDALKAKDARIAELERDEQESWRRKQYD